MDNCPDCGAPAPVHDTLSLAYAYKDRHTTIPAVSGYHCVQCGGVALDPAALQRHDEFVAQFHRRVDSEMAEPAYIAAVRHKLRLDPREADEVFGVHGFAHYESGKALPHPSTVKLLQLLDRHPELLAELRE